VNLNVLLNRRMSTSCIDIANAFISRSERLSFRSRRDDLAVLAQPQPPRWLSQGRSVIRKMLLLFLFVSSPSLLCVAQTNVTDAALNGYVTDSSGAAVPNAHIVARDLSTNVTTEVTSDANGYYTGSKPALRVSQI